MAIVKMKYTRSIAGIKKHLRYITHRPGRDQEKITRALFDQHGLSDKPHAYQMIDAAKRPIFFKAVISPDPNTEDRHKDLNLQFLTMLTMLQMQHHIGRRVQFVAAIHNDHTPHRHIHAIAVVQGRIAKADFQKLKTLWKTATQEARSQRRMRDRVWENPQYRFLTQARFHTRSVSAERRERLLFAKPLRLQHGCFNCGYGQFTGIPSYRLFCPRCRKPLKQERTVRFELGIQT